MKRNSTIITTIIVLVLAALGGTSAYIKHLSIEFKNETKLNNKTTVYLNEVNINEELAENIPAQNNSVTDKNDKASKDYIKSVKKNKTANAITDIDNENKTADAIIDSNNGTAIARMEIPALNIKADLFSSQLTYTDAGLNKTGNSVIYLENTEYEGILEGTEIYIRNAAQEKMIYMVYNIYETTLTDTSFYENNSGNIELTLVVKQESDVLVIQARQE